MNWKNYVLFLKKVLVVTVHVDTVLAHLTRREIEFQSDGLNFHHHGKLIHERLLLGKFMRGIYLNKSFVYS